ncbi:MAG: UDP-N-acetylmuramoyl-L-alanine--D-glutamate ligase [Deltaproteobacteria bacterium]|nr:UDP-N-acetylmuramoyl-L-alanine--D-glutamate ligase [Deltaproteobacteria bacterium]
MTGTTTTVEELLEAAVLNGAAVLGTGVTGLAAASWLTALDIPVIVYDEGAVAAGVKESFARLGITVVDRFSPDSTELSREFSFFVPSPGVGPNHAFARKFLDAAIPALSEIDVFEYCAGAISVAVTGSNGKSTVTSIIADMFVRDSRRAELAGNIGRSLFEVLRGAQERREQDFPAVVAELSSYQLEWAEHCAPRVGVWLNLSENHLERHGTMSGYLDAKSKLFSTQHRGRDVAVLNRDDPAYAEMRARCRGDVFEFGETVAGDGCRLDAQKRFAEVRVGTTVERFDLAPTTLIGKHNQMNWCAAIAAAHLSGVSRRAIEASIAGFRSLEHRLEMIATGTGPVFINDSKATSVAAAVTAVDAVRTEFPDRRIILLVGGQAKRGSWRPLANALGTKIRDVVGFGADGATVVEQIRAEMVGTLKNWPTFSNLDEAVTHVMTIANSDAVVLFAPGCASFDAFSGFDERGRHFRRLVSGNTP